MFFPKELLVGIETSDDAAVYKLNEEQALVATVDFFTPIVDDPFHYGQIAATNAFSDVYAMGGRPIMAMAIVGMPIKTLDTETIATVLEGGKDICDKAKVPIAGGHSIDSLEPIYGLVVMGIVHPRNVRRNADTKVGDHIILGKPIGVGILASALKHNSLDEEGYRRLIDLTTKLNTPGADLAVISGVHGMTDVTGFGLAGHALEMAKGSGHSVRIVWKSVPVLEGVRDFASRGLVTGASKRNWDSYGRNVAFETAGESFSEKAELAPSEIDILTDPQTSGGLLVSCAADAVETVLGVFRDHGFISAVDIG